MGPFPVVVGDPRKIATGRVLRAGSQQPADGTVSRRGWRSTENRQCGILGVSVLCRLIAPGPRIAVLLSSSVGSIQR